MKEIQGILYTVATPIGNMEDITYRAVRILGEADLIACEDTRETGKLLAAYGLESVGKLTSYHAQSADSREDELMAALHDGKKVALVSDRGTPGISDPGSRLIRRAVEAGVQVVPIPGATALAAGLQAAGVDTSNFEYVGFVPHKKGRQTMLEHVARSAQTLVMYESPHRITKTLESLTELCPTKRVVVCRELTKMHEEFIRGTAAEVLAILSKRDSIKGEIVLIVSE